jgi:hypothetical protein
MIHDDSDSYSDFDSDSHSDSDSDSDPTPTRSRQIKPVVRVGIRFPPRLAYPRLTSPRLALRRLASPRFVRARANARGAGQSVLVRVVSSAYVVYGIRLG